MRDDFTNDIEELDEMGGGFAASYRDIDPRQPAKGDPKMPVIETADDLQRMRFPPISYIVPGFVAEGATILAGRPKLGKSWMMMEAAIAVATGGTCWGNIPVEEGDVLLLALEDNRRRLQRRFDKLMGMLAEWPRRLSYATEWPRASDGGLDHIRNWILRVEKPRLVVVDVLMMFRPMSSAKDSPYEADYHAVKGLQELAGEFGIAIVIVHHTRKGGGEHDPFEKVSGTLGLSGAADSALILDRDGNGATLYGRGRDIEEIESAITFDKSACRWVIIGEASEVRRTDERGSILAALADSDEPMSPTEIADAARMSNQNVRQLLVKMVKAGDVTKVSRGLYLHPDHNTPPDHNDHKITNLADYKAAKDGEAPAQRDLCDLASEAITSAAAADTKECNAQRDLCDDVIDVTGGHTPPAITSAPTNLADELLRICPADPDVQNEIMFWWYHNYDFGSRDASPKSLVRSLRRIAETFDEHVAEEADKEPDDRNESVLDLARRTSAHIRDWMIPQAQQMSSGTS